jgi:hypothetical protein
MKYLIMIYHNQEAMAVWDGMSAEEQQAGIRQYTGFHDELAASGELVVSEALADPASTTTVTRHDNGKGKVTTADGPFAEAKEYLAGFFLIDCKDKKRAIEIAGQVPEAAFGLVEVRPVQDLGEMVKK